MTYPSPTVQHLIADELVPVRLYLNDRTQRGHFRSYQVIWTPTIVIADWRGTAHYHSPAFLPPDDFMSMLHLGLARAEMAWSRYPAAIARLEATAAAGAESMAPEALFWLGIARFLKTRRQGAMAEAWAELRARFPTSPWAARASQE